MSEVMIMISRRSIPAILTITLVWTTGAAMAASPPELVNYQGVLRDDVGAPLDGSFDMVFRL
jgi:hypothetical protein